MSNKIKSVFRLKGLFSKTGVQEYSFFSEYREEPLCRLILPDKVFLKKASSENSFKISVNNLRIKLNKKLKKKLGFFSNFLSGNLSLKRKPVVRRIFLVGTGFKVFMGKRKGSLIFKIGLSHLVWVSVPLGIDFQIIKFNEIKFYSLSKELMGSFLNFVASIRFPDSYKGRGLLISNQPKVKFKRGKIKS
jgi:hypothetical protein